MKLSIINYGAGNIKSIQFAFQRLGYDAVLTDNPEIIKASDKVIFPGVGEASSAIEKTKTNRIRFINTATNTARFRDLFRYAINV